MANDIVQNLIKRFPFLSLYHSFRFKIVVTVTVIVALIGFVAFQLFTAHLDRQLHQCNTNNLKSLVSILKDQYLYLMDEDNPKIIFSLLDKLSENPNVLNVYLIDRNGHPVYPHHSDFQRLALSEVPEYVMTVDSIDIRELGNSDSHFFRTTIRIKNAEVCYDCHAPRNAVLGYLIIDFSAEEIEGYIADTKNFGRVFTFSLVVIIFTTIGFLHYRYIKLALNRFIETFQYIERGDLTHRINIPEKNELGLLARQFNQTLDKLQEYQSKIEDYHRRELMNTQKLATVGEMAASFAHEIKNPLTGIVNALNILASDMDDPEKETILKEIQYQTIRVNKAINDLLQFSKPIKLCLETNNINQLLISIKRTVQTQAKDKQIEFVLKLDHRVPAFKFDYNQMENAISNVVINAVQAIPSNGRVVLETRLSDSKDRVAIIIADTGVGISEEHLDKIFKPFFTTKHQGTGLGLAIARDIIERHGGTILVESKKNKGTRFSIEIPIKI